MLPDKKYSELTYEQQLALTQDVRADTLDALLTNENGRMPTDKDSVELLLKVTDSMDRTTLSNRKIANDSQASDNSTKILESIATIIRQAKNRNVFAADEGEALGDEPTVPVEALEDFEHVAGEEHVGIVNETSEEFNKRMEHINQEKLDKEYAELGLK